jgi:hypothetical protein
MMKATDMYHRRPIGSSSLVRPGQQRRELVTFAVAVFP